MRVNHIFFMVAWVCLLWFLRLPVLVVQRAIHRLILYLYLLSTCHSVHVCISPSRCVQGHMRYLLCTAGTHFSLRLPPQCTISVTSPLAAAATAVVTPGKTLVTTSRTMVDDRGGGGGAGGPGGPGGSARPGSGGGSGGEDGLGPGGGHRQHRSPVLSPFSTRIMETAIGDEEAPGDSSDPVVPHFTVHHHLARVVPAGAVSGKAAAEASDAQGGGAAPRARAISAPVLLLPRTPRRRRVAGARVLVVDDSEANRRFAAFVLRRLGCTVTTVADGDEVERTVTAAEASGEPYDAVLMDLVMVRMRARGAARWL